MSKQGRLSKSVKFTALAVLFSIPFLIFDAYILHKPDFSGIAADSLIISDSKLKLLPACGNLSPKFFYIKQYNNKNWSLRRDGAVPAVGNDVSISVAFDKIRSCDKQWYGYDCQVQLSNSNNLITGNATNNRKTWDQSVKQNTAEVKPGFRFQMPVPDETEKFSAVVSMEIEYPVLAKEGFLYKSYDFINRTTRLSKTYQLQVIPMDKFVQLVNYQQWTNRWAQVFLVGMFNLITVLVIAIFLFSKHK